MQLAHAGRKGSCTRPWEGGQPLPEGGWELLGPSALPFAPGWPVPRAMERADLDRVREDFVRAAREADEAGFDVLELHMAHGYLLATFLSPLTNRREDEYGGPVEGRLRYPLEVLRAVRDAWPAQKPLSVRISATDWAPGGTGSLDRIAIGQALHEHGADIVDVSAGGTVPDQRPVYGRMYLVPFSEEIRLEAGVPTMTVGNIQDVDQANTMLAAGRADLWSWPGPTWPTLSDPARRPRATAWTSRGRRNTSPPSPPVARVEGRLVEHQLPAHRPSRGVLAEVGGEQRVQIPVPLAHREGRLEEGLHRHGQELHRVLDAP